MRVTSAASDSLARVVVMDDEVAIKDAICDDLEGRFTVKGFLSSESILRELPSSNEPMVFVLDDCRATGKEDLLEQQGYVRQELSSKFRNGKFVWMSGRVYAGRGLVEQAEAEAAGFDAFLQKPFSLAQLVQVIQRLDENSR